MRSAFAAILLLFGTFLESEAAGAGRPALQRFPRAGCEPDTSSFAGHLKHYYQLVVSDSDSVFVAVRERWPANLLPADSVTLIPDEDICAIARAAYNREFPSDSTTGPVVVVKMGGMRVVVAVPPDLGQRTGLVWNLVTDSTFTVVIDRFTN